MQLTQYCFLYVLSQTSEVEKLLTPFSFPQLYSLEFLEPQLSVSRSKAWSLPTSELINAFCDYKSHTIYFISY